MRRDDGRGIVVKGNNDGRWSSDGVVLWLWRRQNGDAVEWWGEWLRLRWPFYSNGGWESGGPTRVANSSAVESMVQFWLERGGDRMKRCLKVKRWQRAHHGSMRRKSDTTRRCGDIDPRRGGTGEGKGMRRCQLVDENLTLPKNEENPHGRFICYKWTMKI
jgi:hypothetical protein